jgi:hypothetical protein
MTTQDIRDALTDLLEIRKEITKVNRNAGQTIFNPAATQALEAIIQNFKDKIDA